MNAANYVRARCCTCACVTVRAREIAERARERESERAREREGAWRRERALHSRGKPQSKCDPAEIWFRSPVTTIKHKHVPGRYSSPPVVLRTFRSSCNSQTPQKNPTGPSPGRPMHRDALPLPTTHTHTLNPNPFPGGAMHEDALPRLEMSCTTCTVNALQLLDARTRPAVAPSLTDTATQTWGF